MPNHFFFLILSFAHINHPIQSFLPPMNNHLNTSPSNSFLYHISSTITSKNSLLFFNSTSNHQQITSIIFHFLFIFSQLYTLHFTTYSFIANKQAPSQTV